MHNRLRQVSSVSLLEVIAPDRPPAPAPLDFHHTAMAEGHFLRWFVRWLLMASPSAIAMLGAWLNLTYVWIVSPEHSAESSVATVRIVACLVALQLLTWLAGILYDSIRLRLRRRSPWWMLRSMYILVVIAACFLVAALAIIVAHELADGPSIMTVGGLIVETCSSAGRCERRRARTEPRPPSSNLQPL